MDKTGFFHAPYRQKTQKQSKHYILVGKLQNTAVKGQVKGNFWEQSKEEKPEGIFFSVGGVKKSLYQQKTENRESQSSNASQHLVNLRAEKTGRIGEGCRQLIIIGIDYSVLQDYCAYMVDEHENKSK